VIEQSTSRKRSICRVKREGARAHRGLYICEKIGKKLNADLNAASNIANRAGYEVMIEKIESYRVTHNSVILIAPSRGDRNPYNESLRGRGYMTIYENNNVLSVNGNLKKGFLCKNAFVI